MRAEERRAHVQTRLDAVSLSHRERPSVGRLRLRKKTFGNESQLTETVRTDGCAAEASARVSVCVGADADVLSAHLRNVCGGQSLKAPPTDNVYAALKASFRSTDEENPFTLAPPCPRRVRVRPYLSLCVTVRLRGEETTSLCNGEGGVHQR